MTGQFPLLQSALSRCPVCGSDRFGYKDVLWRELIQEWDLSDEEISTINRQQGLYCEACGNNLRSMALANAILKSCGCGGPLTDFVRSDSARLLSCLEINESGHLTSVLADLPNHCLIRYPDCDMMNLDFPDSSFDLVIHSDTLEHVPRPVAGLSECRRVLSSSGRCLFTVPVLPGRLSRSRLGMKNSYHGSPDSRSDDLIVHTEFGADVWRYALEAGFKKVVIHALEYPAAMAVEASASKEADGGKKTLPWTGERYVSHQNLSRIGYEHWHRYLYTTPYVRGKDVLDIACGEGYGANLMAGLAHLVTGVDVAEEAIAFATEKYPAANLSFLRGAVDNIPVAGKAKYDVIVSFETIEHVDAQTQERFMQEARRLLKEDGVMIVSSPNKLLYSDLPGFKNAFHLKEFYEREYVDFLKRYFSHVALLGQNISVGSTIWGIAETGRGCPCVEYRLAYEGGKFVPCNDKKQALYLIAVCSDKEIPSPADSFLVDLSESLLKESDELILKCRQALSDCDGQIEEIRRSLSDRDEEITDLRQDLSERDRQIAASGRTLCDRQAEVSALLETLFHRDKTIDEVLHSRSWRFTLPLRIAGGVLRRMKRFIRDFRL